MDRTKSAIMNPAQAIAVVTFPILLAGLVRLKLCQLLLQTALYRLAFAQLQADVLGARSIDNPFDDCDFPTLRNAIDPDARPRRSSSITLVKRVPLPKRPRLPEDSYPHLFSVPHSHRLWPSGSFLGDFRTPAGARNRSRLPTVRCQDTQHE
ncbi:hypothetical protein BTE77_16330 [Ensifer adhaerens]|nr:hypothetical protein BTE77_16330 [Ensifer adhaerens]